MSQHDTHKPLQSAYCKSHSSQTAIYVVHVLNDLPCAIGNNDMVIVSLLDCSAAFDLVDHFIMLHHLEDYSKNQLGGPGGVRHLAFGLVMNSARTTSLEIVRISHGWLVLAFMPQFGSNLV